MLCGQLSNMFISDGRLVLVMSTVKYIDSNVASGH